MSRPGGAAAWNVFPYLLARVPALPHSQLLAFRYEDALEAHGAARRRAEAVRARGERLADAIAELVPQAPTAIVRRGLLATRRAAFNARPLPRGYQGHLIAAGGRLLLQDALAWEREREQWQRCLADRDRLFAGAGRAADVGLMETLRDPVVALALTLANPQLADRLERIAPTSVFDLRGRERRAVGAGARMLWRAGLRATPNGLLAGTGLARLSATGPRHDMVLTPRHVDVRPRQELVAELRRQTLASPAILSRAMVRVRADYAPEEGGAGPHAGIQRHPPSGTAKRLSAAFADVPDDPGAALPVSELTRRGASMADLAEGLRAGILEWDLPYRESDDDPLAGLTRLLWEAAPADVSLLTTLAAVDAYRESLNAITRAAETVLSGGTVPPVERRSLRSACGPAEASVDTVLGGEQALATDELTPFFDTVAEFGAGWVDPHPSLEEQILARVFKEMYPPGAVVPVARFHADYLQCCQRHGVDSDAWTNARELAPGLGIGADDRTAGIRADVEELVSVAGDDEQVLYRPGPARLAGWQTDELRRLAFRFRVLRGIEGGRQCQLVLWGGPWMTLLARYSRLAGQDAERLRDGIRQWMAHWSDVADVGANLGRSANVRPPVTRLTIQLPGHGWQDGDVSLRELVAVMDEDEGRVKVVLRGTGERVRPVFFGVSHARLLPGLVSFLMHLAGHGRSLLDLVCEAVNTIHLDRQSSARVTRIPGICLTESALLAPEAFVVPVGALPAAQTPVDRDGFFAVHDWLEQWGLPSRFVQVRVGTDDREPVWLDLAHPEGVNGLLRCARQGRPLTLYPPVALEGPGLTAPEGTYDVEYYAELAAGSAVPGRCGQT